MLVSRGANTPFGREKFYLELDETDLIRMIAERGAENPAEVSSRMTTYHAFKILDHEVQVLLHLAIKDMETEREKIKDHLDKAARHRAERDRYLDFYLPRPVPEEEPAAEPAEAPA